MLACCLDILWLCEAPPIQHVAIFLCYLCLIAIHVLAKSTGDATTSRIAHFSTSDVTMSIASDCIVG